MSYTPRATVVLLCSLLLLNGAGATGQTLPSSPRDGVFVVADFDKGAEVVVVAKNAQARVSTGGAAHGESFLRIEPRSAEGGTSYVRLRLPDSAAFVGRERLTASLRGAATSDDEKPLDLSWMVLDGGGNPIFLRRFSLKPGE